MCARFSRVTITGLSKRQHPGDLETGGLSRQIKSDITSARTGTYATESSTNFSTWVSSGVYLLNGDTRDIIITNPAASLRGFYRAYIHFDP